MCGIAGMYIPKERRIPDLDLGRMLSFMRHRGPDGDGFWKKPEPTLSDRRSAASRSLISRPEISRWLIRAQTGY